LSDFILSKGADVVVSVQTEEKLEQAMSSLIGKISGYVLDVTDAASIQRFFKNVGVFDHLVTPAASSMFAPIKAMDFDAARLMIESKQWVHELGCSLWDTADMYGPFKNEELLGKAMRGR
jgi:NADP-dependent 3-hydroxy acid dehydrogenase YdfG